MSETFFGKAPLNRVSFLRGDTNFIDKALSHDSSIFIPYVEGEALVKNNSLLLLTRPDIEPILEKVVPILNTPKVSLKHSGVNFSFIGLHEGGSFKYKEYEGIPYFAIDFRSREDTLVGPDDVAFLSLYPKLSRTEIFTWGNEIASIYSHGKMYLDWLAKYQYCPSCGSEIYPVDAGTRLKCSNQNTDADCAVRDANVNNVCFPRTDPVVIVAITTSDYSKLCLARSKRKYGNSVLYSTIAGFMEPAETVEHACTREIWEETGVECSRINIICTQPWPYPVNLMIGCVGVVDWNGKNELINLSHDEELLDAQWFDTTEIARYMDSYQGDGLVEFKDGIKFPGNTAIAHQLICYVCDKFKRNQANL